MTNKYKGEVSFDAGGEAFVLRFSANAVVALEEAFDQTIRQLGETMSNVDTMRMSSVKKMFCIGLVDHYAEAGPEIDEKKAATIFARLGPIEATQVVVRAFTAAFEIDGGGRPAATVNPPPAPIEGPPTGTG